MAILEISIIPLGTNSSSIGNLITESCQLVKANNLEYKVTPTSTIIEGDLEDLFNVARQMHKAPFKNGIDRVITSIKIDDRHDKPLHMDDMIEEVIDEL